LGNRKGIRPVKTLDVGLLAEITNSRTTAFEFQDLVRAFQDLGFFSRTSRPVNLNILIPGLSTVCMNAVCSLYSLFWTTP